MKSNEKKIAMNGKSVAIQVYEDGAGGWLLEIVDEYWNSACWQSPLETAEEAFIEATKAIKEEGIDALLALKRHETLDKVSVTMA